MGKRKIHDWQYKSKKREPPETKIDFATRQAFYLAQVELQEKEKARKILAVDKVAKEATDELSNKYTDWDLGCMAIVLHRRYEKDAQEIADFLTEVQNLTAQYIREGVTCETIWDIVRDEVGLGIERMY